MGIVELKRRSLRMLEGAKPGRLAAAHTSMARICMNTSLQNQSKAEMKTRLPSHCAELIRRTVICDKRWALGGGGACAAATTLLIGGKSDVTYPARDDISFGRELHLPERKHEVLNSAIHPPPKPTFLIRENSALSSLRHFLFLFLFLSFFLSLSP